MDALPSNLWEFILSIPESERFPLVLCTIMMGLLALVAVVGIVSHTVKVIHKNRIDDALKRELVDRGMSAEEIERVVRAPRRERLKSIPGVDT